MKSSVCEVKYKDTSIVMPGSGWWTYDCSCDKCGKDITKIREVLSSRAPDITELDLCVTCMRELFDKGITYEQAIKKYSKTIKD